MKNILVTGAGGYLGGVLINELVKLKNVNIKGLTFKRTVDRKIPNCQFFKADVTNTKSFEKELYGIDEIYHLAAYAKMWSKDKFTSYNINVKGTENIIKTAIKAKVKKIVITSTAGIFGHQRGKTLISEKLIHNNKILLFTEYDKTKDIANKMAKKYINKIQIVFVSPTRLYGPGIISESNAATRLAYFCVYKKLRFIPGDGKKTGNYVFVNDVAKGHILAMEKGGNGENYILGGSNLSYKEFYEKIYLLSSKKRKIIPTSLPIMLIVSYLILFFANVFKKQPFIVPSFILKYFHNWSVDISKAEEELGYSHTPFDKGMKVTLNWMKNNLNSFK